MKPYRFFTTVIVLLFLIVGSLNADEFVRVNSVSDLHAGDQVLIVYDNGTTTFAMGKEATNVDRRLSNTVVINDDKISDPNGARIFELQGNASSWQIYDLTSCRYLAWGGGSSDDLKTVDVVNTNSSWTIRFDDNKSIVIANVANSYRVIRRASSQSFFGCYPQNSDSTPAPNMNIFKREQAIPESVTVTLGETGYSTLYYSDRSLVVPDGLTAHTLRLSGDDIVWSTTYTSGMTIARSTGVLLHGKPGSYTFAGSNEEGVADENNMLKGLDVAGPTVGGDIYYFLSKDPIGTGSVGFFWGEAAGGAFTSGAHKAYLAVPQSSASKPATGYLLDKLSTGIQGLASHQQMLTPAVSRIFGLNGQQVNPSYKGLIIKNGKKYLNK
jgi:hypothetical protein